MNNTARLAAIDALLATLPHLECKRLCQECCGPIVMSRLEWKRICEHLGHVPKGREDWTCPMLKDGLCSVYPIRPAVCHLWGISAKMPCPWGCKPDRELSEAEEVRLLSEISRLGV